MIPVVPYECEVKFFNPFTKKKTLFKKVYIKIIGNLFRESNKAFNFKNNKQDNALNKRKYPIISKNDDSLFENYQHEFPKNLIVNETTKTVDFHCMIKVSIITLSWTLESASKLHSGIIYQKESGIAQNFVDLFSVNTSLAGQHSLTVLQVSPITAGTYTCIVTFQNETSVSYPAGLVIANFIVPLSLKYTPNRRKILLHCSIKFCGNMQPFLRCEDQLDLYGIMTVEGKIKKVVFEKVINMTSSPIVCSLWFKHSRGEEIFHKKPILLMDAPMGVRAANDFRNKIASHYYLYSMLFTILKYF